MKIETTNVIEILDGKILQIFSFVGNNAKAEAYEVFRRLVLEHNDPENNPPKNVLNITEDVLAKYFADGLYDDECGYTIWCGNSN